MEGIAVKRIYEPPEEADGRRILVDRIWPRGMTKERAQLALWMKEVAPSPQLRTWFGHRPDRFDRFQARYMAELSEDAARPHLERLADWARSGRVTLLYAARDERHNHALVLKRCVERMMAACPGEGGRSAEAQASGAPARRQASEPDASRQK